MVDAFGQESSEILKELVNTQGSNDHSDTSSMANKRGWEAWDTIDKRGWEAWDAADKRGWEAWDTIDKRDREDLDMADKRGWEAWDKRDRDAWDTADKRGWEAWGPPDKRSRQSLDTTDKRGWEAWGPPDKRNRESLDTADKRGWEAWDLPWVKAGRPVIKRAWEALGIDFGNGIINRETLDQLKRGWEGFNLPYGWPQKQGKRSTLQEHNNRKRLANDIKAEPYSCRCCKDNKNPACCLLCSIEHVLPRSRNIGKGYASFKNTFCKCCSLFKESDCCRYCSLLQNK